MKTKSLFFLVSLTLSLTLFLACKKTPSVPPVQSVAVGPAVTIQQLRNMYANINLKFTSNTILRAVVTCDEASGNLYKQVYVRDNSGMFAATNNYGAISLHFLKGTQGFLNVGDSIAVNLNGATLDESGGGSLEVDSIDAVSQVVHLKSGLSVQPLLATLPQLNTYVNGTGGGFIYDGQLVQLNNVEFIQPNVGLSYAAGQNPPAAPISYNRYISDFIGNTLVTYNSGYSNFAYTSTSPITIPSNSGSITGVANLYTTMQFTIRSYADINLGNAYNPIVYDTITQNFSCGALSSKGTIVTAGWKSIPYIGAINWQGSQYSLPPNWKYSPGASNYKSTDIRNDIWLVSPPIADHGGTPTKYMDFSAALQYGTSYRLLSVLVSRTFDGTHIIPSQWTDISSLYPNIPPTASAPSSNGYPSFKYTANPSSLFNPSPIPLTVGTPGSTPTFYVAFRYQSSTANTIAAADSSGATYMLGTFVLRNN
jgi:hypothetical protein